MARAVAVTLLFVTVLASAQQQKSLEKALAERRAQIDAIDARLVSLLNERARIVQEIGRIKRQMNAPVSAPKREQEVLRNVRQHNTGPLSPEAVARIYERVIAEMTALEQSR